MRQLSFRTSTLAYTKGRLLIKRIQASLFWKGLAATVAILLMTTCTPEKGLDPTFTVETVPQRVPIEPGLIDEASGIADSQTMNGYLWVEEDSGNPSQLNLLSHAGKLIGRIHIPGVMNRDWEDLAIGPGPQSGVSYLYVADIGDNAGGNAENYIYRLAEPTSLTAMVSSVDRIAFRYADGPHDAETLLLDPLTRDLWIVTKAADKARLYQLAYPQTTASVSTATFRGEVPLSLVTSGSISPDGTDIVLKTYVGIAYWRRTTKEGLDAVLTTQQPRSLPYLIEPQGEAIGFDKAGNGFFTLSERGNAASVTLNYYKRL
ncbi:PE-PGRS family protein [Spirosoma sp. 209]|uniref:PE-PGRS family protein n=1 Tax=Spirosoma sp. 209 TaxID=1955701 RepID=UPI00098D405A|nr:PE-PGRS family protein [Spirosoma sp. 209]